MRAAHWIAISTLLGACYAVDDLKSPDAAPIGHGDGSASGGVFGGTGGGAGAAGQTGGAAGAEADATPDVGDAPSIPDATLDVKPDVIDAPNPVGSWSSCKSLGYKGDCIGTNTVMYFDAPATCNTDGVDSICYVSQCKTIGASCLYDSTCGWDCNPKLSSTAVQHCGSELAGKCIDGVAIKADSSDANNCLYKECAKLSAECQVKSGKADCY